jgi:hypothetical protein
MTTDYLSLEWQTLQNQFDSYEKYSLIIKLAAIFTTALALGFGFASNANGVCILATR